MSSITPEDYSCIHQATLATSGAAYKLEKGKVIEAECLLSTIPAKCLNMAISLASLRAAETEDSGSTERFYIWLKIIDRLVMTDKGTTHPHKDLLCLWEIDSLEMALRLEKRKTLLSLLEDNQRFRQEVDLMNFGDLLKTLKISGTCNLVQLAKLENAEMFMIRDWVPKLISDAENNATLVNVLSARLTEFCAMGGYTVYPN